MAGLNFKSNHAWWLDFEVVIPDPDSYIYIYIEQVLLFRGWIPKLPKTPAHQSPITNHDHHHHHHHQSPSPSPSPSPSSSSSSSLPQFHKKLQISSDIFRYINNQLPTYQLQRFAKDLDGRCHSCRILWTSQAFCTRGQGETEGPDWNLLECSAILWSSTGLDGDFYIIVNYNYVCIYIIN